MAFTLLPAVDVSGGQAVRLSQGDTGSQLATGDARDAALQWQAEGAAWVHLVDLDAAFDRGSNANLLAGVIDELDVKVQLAGGITDDRSLQQALATGCERVVIGTAALSDPGWCGRLIDQHGRRVAIGLDVRVGDHEHGPSDEPPRHRLAARGSTVNVGDLWETLELLDQAGCARYIVTDVSRDGMLNGPNVDLLRAVTAATPAQVIASGGISALDDLIELAKAANASPSLEGAVVGKALYAGRFNLPEALQVVG